MQTTFRATVVQLRWLFLLIAIGVAAATAWLTRSSWRSLVESQNGTNARQHLGHDPNEAPNRGPAYAGHSPATSIELSDKALKNIGYRPVTIEMTSFERALTLPAMVVEQPGRTQVHVTTPLTGIIKKIYAVAGEVVEANSPMFDIQLTEEQLVSVQRDFLQTAENLDVVNREIKRLRSLGEGVIAGKRILEQEYEKQKYEAALRAGEQALLLHGLDQEQVSGILKSRKLFSAITIRAPLHSHADDGSQEEIGFHVQSLPVSPGEQVVAGQELSVLADHDELYVEGRAFEDDAMRLRQALREGWNIEASLMVGDRQVEKFKNLKLLYLSDKIDPESRAFRFFLRLPNEVVHDQQTPDGRRYVEWKFKPGQRMELRIPIEKWEESIVLPVDAVVEEGAEMYAYRQNGDHFDQVPVHVKYRDREYVVLENDGDLFPGDIVAGRGAYQIHLTLKNSSGGGIDPHAGHSH